MSSLFIIYDPYSFYMNLSLNWVLFFFIFSLYFYLYWVVLNNTGFFFFSFTKFLLKEFAVFYSSNKLMKGGLILFISVFIFILFTNILGIFPFYFSFSSHMVYSLFLSFPFWLSFYLFSWVKFTNKSFSHLIPLGTPLFLIPLMVLIETISNFIRSGSLAVRLVSNMISGHLLMSLLGDCGLMLIFFQLVLFLFEFFVCFIQSYVFSALLTLYSSEI